MPLSGEYEPSQLDWVRKHVEAYEKSGGTEKTTLRGVPVIVVTSRGAKTGRLRKNPVMRVEHNGKYAAIASMGGQPKNPVWYYNLLGDPHVEVQDGPMKKDMIAREVTGDEKAEWWDRALVVWPDYADYQARTERVIPVFVLEPED